MKKLIIFIGVIILSLIIINPFHFEKKQDVKKENTIKLSFPNEKIGYVNIHNIYIIKEKDYYIFTANVTNLTADTLDYKSLIVNANNNILTGYFGKNIEANTTKKVIIKTKKDLSNVKKIFFELKN